MLVATTFKYVLSTIATTLVTTTFKYVLSTIATTLVTTTFKYVLSFQEYFSWLATTFQKFLVAKLHSIKELESEILARSELESDILPPTPQPWMLLLQPLRWYCVDCVIHHERDVREEQHHTYMWREQAITEWSWHVNSIDACCHSAKLCAYAARDFRSQRYT